MRTFEEFKSSILRAKHNLMSRCQYEIKAGRLDDDEERVRRMVIRNRQLYIDNIDEVTTINIGATTNSLIRTIQKAYQQHSTDYLENFERFATEYIVGIIDNGEIKRQSQFVNSSGNCNKLGIGVDELATCFKGKSPMDNESGDFFRQLINLNYGTNIPMAGVQEQLLKDWKTSVYYESGSDQKTKDTAFVKLREAQRESGLLQNGGDYYLLANV